MVVPNRNFKEGALAIFIIFGLCLILLTIAGCGGGERLFVYKVTLNGQECPDIMYNCKVRDGAPVCQNEYGDTVYFMAQTVTVRRIK